MVTEAVKLRRARKGQEKKCFFRVVGPKNIPADRVSRLENAFPDAAKDPRFRKRAEESKIEIVSLSSKAYSQETAEVYSELETIRFLEPALGFEPRVC